MRPPTIGTRVAGFLLVVTGLSAPPLAGQTTLTSYTLTGDLQPLEITPGPDGNLWFTVFGNGSAGMSKVGRITTGGTITEFTLPDTSRPVGIVAGPDGKMWFTESANGAPYAAIGRIDPATFPAAGSVTHFNAGLTPTAHPFGICVGPDGNLWFAERDANAIGRITTAGVITQFPLGTPSGTPLGIVSAPDGNLWFTMRDPVNSSIGAISTAGVLLKRMNTPTVLGNPTGITVGPDGRLWFVEFDGNKVGVVSTSATSTTDITEYPTPTPTPYRIVTGPDGALWFTENNGTSGTKLGRITTAGVITEYSTQGLVGPYGITKGPDNAIWFTARDDNPPKIGRLSLDCTVCTVGPLRFYPIPPCRRIDTRLAVDGPALSPGEQRSLVLVSGPCSVPSTAHSVSVNATVTQTAGGGDLKFFPTGAGVPVSTTLSFSAGQTRANNALFKLSSDGTGRVDVKNDASGNVHVIVDVNGYFQ